MKLIEVKFDLDTYKEYKLLEEKVKKDKQDRHKPTNKQLLDSINRAIENIKYNYKCGDLIPRKYIPKDTVKKYGTDKILRVELVGYWRLLYTIIGDEIKIVAFILEFMNHSNYNKRFGYKKK